MAVFLSAKLLLILPSFLPQFFRKSLNQKESPRNLVYTQRTSLLSRTAVADLDSKFWGEYQGSFHWQPTLLLTAQHLLALTVW